MRFLMRRRLPAVLVFWVSLSLVLAGVGKEVENEYKQRYENKALFLKQPVRGERQTFYLRGRAVVPDTSNLGQALTFRVGEQVRILEVNFRDSEIEFKLGSIDLARRASVYFDFGQSIPYTFPQRPSFDTALGDTFTEGLTYSDLDKAKSDFVKDQYSRLVNQFADTTGTSEKFVEQAILGAIPETVELRKQVQDTRQQLEQTKQQLSEEQRLRQAAESQASEANQELTAARGNATDLQTRYNTVSAERDRLQREVGRLGDENRQFKAQVDAIARKLDVQTGSTSKLGAQVGDLTRSLDELTQERTRLTAEVGQLEQKVGQLTQDREKLTRDLGDARKKSTKLEGDLRALTSNRESLEATYLRTKEAKDAFERAGRLSESLSLRPSSAEPTKEGAEQADVYLLSQPIGTIEVQPPTEPGATARLVVRTASPNTVQFTEEERELYAALGNELKIQPTWKSWSGVLQPVLDSGDAVQAAAPREESAWQWSFQGSASGPERLLLDLRIIDADGQAVPLGEYQFQVSGAGWISALDGSSAIPALLGFLLGVALVGLAVALRDRRRPQAKTLKTVSVPGSKQL